MYQQHMLLKLRKPILKYTLNKYHVHWLSSFKHLNLPISIKIMFVCFVALRPKATAMVMAGRSVHLITLFPGQA